ncbi:MAG: tRNA epoxyqueuosine(34) reductase QueG, partial [Bacteroidota bacterium]
MKTARLHAEWVKEEAKRIGFHACGISRAEFLEEDAPRLEQWLKSGMQGHMGYMERNFDMRLDPRKLVPGARSVVSLLFNYHNPDPVGGDDTPRIAQYAYGEDYHFVLRDKLRELLDCLRARIGQIEGRIFVDSAPVLEKSWAARSGLGWVGKNTNLITREQGSYFFLCELISDLELAPDGSMADYCGTCTRCIDACPTEAILPDKVIDGSRCISYFTIELKEQLIPGEMKGRFDGWMFGCDVCQDVCPWNRFSTPTREPAFRPLPEILNY